ncbi:NTP transferase domain-containing protein [Natrononativus amylolyticus]|uniref:phosphocholine cytidylyltransferase family protein n=1 Tax=Natrononativus amylolyticus TaxID=2963434 RepID=UPI0020CC5772|nr:phosphocholine cytidylyltransferase family protein [Natrononativus amylolyticus]
MERRAIVLAAGRGKRLQPLTDDTPKTLLDVGGQPILDHIFDALEATGYDEVVVVTGFEREQIEDHCGSREGLAVEFVHNAEYDSTNNIYSLWLAEEYAADGFTLINADTLFPAASLERLHRAGGSALLVDTRNALEDEEMQVALDAERVETIGKDLDGEDRATGVYLDDGDGEYIGVSRFTAEDAARLFDHLEAFVDRGAVTDWYEAAFDRLFAEREIEYVEIGEPWMEIDTPEDLERARGRWPQATPERPL